MKRTALYLLLTLITPALYAATPDTPKENTIKMVPFPQVKMSDNIWAPRIKMLVSETLPHAFTQTQVAQRRLQLCGDFLENKGTQLPEPHRFNTSDLYKVMEGAALMIAAEPDPSIEAEMDRIIEIIARAQKDDGYLYISHICGNPIVSEMGDKPYSHVIHSHELYNIGHLYEAAVAYAQATGKEKLLQVALKSARHVNQVFFIGDPNYNNGKPVMQAPGHQEIEIGLVKLYNYTGDKLYLDMARKFLDIRGITFIPDSSDHVSTPEYAQQHAPVAQQTTAVGHAVRATYQYAAMAETDSLLHSEEYTNALNSIWHNIVDTKMHINGGLGAIAGIEGFGPEYLLPNKEAYLETCAAVGNVFFNLRMFLKYHEARYVDVAEIALLNNCLSGIGLDGRSFFYPNPLAADYNHQPRSGWFGTACCPSNLSRLIPQIPGFIYATDGQSLYTVLYGSNSTTIKINDTYLTLRQETAYPFSGDIYFTLEPAGPLEFDFKLRIPTWAGSQFVPGELYHYAPETQNIPENNWSLLVNGQPVEAVVEKGYASCRRLWRSGDTITLKLPLIVRENICSNKVEANRQRRAITRGPLLYCAEGIDNGGSVERFLFTPGATQQPAQITISEIKSGDLTGLKQISLPAQELTAAGFKPAILTLIPYFAWSNRDRSSMITWLGTLPEMAKPDMLDPANLKFAAVRASHTFDQDTTQAIRMKHTPRSSGDTSIPRWTSWPQKGKSQWVEIELADIREITAISVYWYNDNGGVQLPAAWHIETPTENGQWQKVEIYNTDQYSTLADNYNLVHPANKLFTNKIRLILTPAHQDTCIGILSVDIETK